MSSPAIPGRSAPATSSQPSGAAVEERRLRARRRAEIRFRLMGVAAVCAAGLALATLVGSLLVQGVSALSAYQITLDVEIPESVDPEGTGDPTVIRRANFNGLLQTALRTEFPQVTARGDLRDLFGLVSSINAGALLDRVIDDPSLVGETVTVEMPISDDADLYFKGRATPRRRITGPAPVDVSIDDAGVVTLTARQDDAFGFLLDDLKREVLAAADAASAEAARREAVVEEDENRARARAAQVETGRARAAELRARALDPTAPEPLGATTPSLLIYIDGGVVKVEEATPDRVTGQALVPLETDAAAPAGDWRMLYLATPEASRRISDSQIVWAEALRDQGRVERVFNGWLFTRSDSREPELAGMKGALIGSVLTMFVTMLMAAPIGVATALYLEEFAPKNRWTTVIEVNINNLAAVPSIVFGLLGLAVFINFFALPRSAPLVGGMVLALMTLPTIIISTRASLKAVPPSIRAGALAVGASPVQTVFHHVLPLAAPGILTGSIIGLAQALGETAPLLMIGMVAFVADPPTGLTSPSTVLPVQIFLWSDSAERSFESRTAALILSLLALMVVLNIVAVVLRRRFERRW